MKRQFGLLALAIVSITALGACVEPATEHRIRANALFKSGDYKEALGECRRGLESKPSDTAAGAARQDGFRAGDLREAEKRIAEAMSAGSGRRRVFLGDAYLGLAVIATRRRATLRGRSAAALFGAARAGAGRRGVPRQPGQGGPRARQDRRGGGPSEQAARAQGNDGRDLLPARQSLRCPPGRPDDAEKTSSTSARSFRARPPVRMA